MQNGSDHKYDDMLHLPHHVSKTRRRMSRQERAAQFSPFAALTGHSAAIAETGRLTASRITLDESEIARVDAALQRLRELLPQAPAVSITYFVPDERKAGGSYQTVTGTARRIDTANGVLLLTDQRAIPIPDILDVAIQKDVLP